MENKQIADTSKLTRFELIFIILAATVTITAVSACSPLYPYNPWDDVNVFLVLGRGIIHGKVPYRDLFDHKGPLLHFIYALAALISGRSFTGVWIIECILASIYSVFSWKIVKLFKETKKHNIVLMLMFPGIIYSMGIFNFGGNAEELCFPVLTVMLYFGLKAIVSGDGLPKKNEAVICGVLAGVLFWIKYSFLGFVIGFCIYLIIIAIAHKDFKKLWSLVWRFIAGFVLISVPILAYFLINNALSDLWEAYFRVNLFLYHETTAPGLAGIPVIKNVFIPVTCTIFTIKTDFTFGILLLLSALSVFFIGKEHRKKTIALLVITFVLAEGIIFSKTTFIYYYGYLLCYGFCMGLIPCVSLINKLSSMYKKDTRFVPMLTSVVLAAIYLFSIVNSKNMYLIFAPKEKLPQFQLAETISQTPDAKVLVYDFIDSGYFTTSGILPSNKYFCYLNIEQNYPAILEEQDRLIEEGYFDYIVTTYFYEEDWDNYEYVQEAAGPYVNYNRNSVYEGYKLYKLVQE
jgi:hypothetical protein